jgi:ornithine cyclodeaminase
VNNYELGYPRANAMVILNDPYTKLPICIADGTAVSATRTGASGGVAVELLSRKDSKVLTLCGAGVQGRTQLKAALVSRPGLTQVNVYDKFPASAQKYVDEMSALYPQLTMKAIGDDELARCVSESDIVITATTAFSPFIKAEWVTKGTLLMNISGYEMERGCVTMADKTVVDFWESVKHRNSSTIARMSNDPEDKYLDFVPTAEVGEILNGEKPGRENDDQIIYFNPVGAGVLDMVIVHRCYEKAVAEGKGQRLCLWEGDE